MKLLTNIIESTTRPRRGDFVYFGPLFRGSSEQFTGNPFYQLPIRTDRKPRDSSAVSTHIFNLMFEMVHGIKNIRTRCIFGTPDYHAASVYSNREGAVSVLLLPKGTKVAYHEDFEDVVNPFGQVIRIISNATTASGETLSTILGVTSPVDALQLMYDLADTLPADAKSNFTQTLNEQVRYIREYKILTITGDNSNIPFCEYMIFDQPHVYAITLDELKKHVGGEYDDDYMSIDDYGMEVDGSIEQVAEDPFEIIRGIMADGQ